MGLRNFKFVDEYSLPGMLFCVAVRTRIRHGKIRSVDIPELPEGYFHILPQDIRGKGTISIGGGEIPILTDEAVECQGQAIALICGPDERIVSRIAGRVGIQYERSEPLAISADIGEAEASRDATIKSAEARQEGEAAKYKAETKIAESKKDYEVQKAIYEAQINQKLAESELAYTLQQNIENQKVKAEEVPDIFGICQCRNHCQTLTQNENLIAQDTAMIDTRGDQQRRH